MQNAGAVTLYGIPVSSYVWSARIALAEKGVAYELVPNNPNSPEQRAVHPFGKVPALAHGDVKLFESQAILRYVDEAFDGPPLQPDDPAGRALMSQWLSVFSAYTYPTLVLGIILPRLNPHFQGPVDEVAIAGAVKQGRVQLELFDKALAKDGWFSGGRISLADITLTPILFYVSHTPEGGALLDGFGNVAAWRERMGSRASVQKSAPMPG
ncbi:MAG: glutathione S-transferase family protein [Nannocystaceae bacterium]|nr:glutathione S-transferase family protein [Myxococcales bacterium]